MDDSVCPVCGGDARAHDAERCATNHMVGQMRQQVWLQIMRELTAVNDDQEPQLRAEVKRLCEEDDKEER
jgi:hypothetical protein